MKYLATWKATKLGFFTDTHHEGADIFEGKNSVDAFKRAVTEVGEYSKNGWIVSVTDIKHI